MERTDPVERTSDDPQVGPSGQSSGDPISPGNPKTFSNEFVQVPTPDDTESVFSYGDPSDPSMAFGTASPPITLSSSNATTPKGLGPPSDDDHKEKLGRAPEALYRVLQKFLAKGKLPPPNFPVPYVIYTNSSGVEKFTDVLTKMPIQINVDDDKDTGKGNGKDIKVKTTMDVSPLILTTTVEALDDTLPPDLEIYVTFPSFFYNGEAGDPEGEPYWMYGYETQPGHDIPGDITMTFTVDISLGSEHIFNFDWTSESGIDPLGFTFGTFQVLDQNTTAPIYPAFSNFVVSSPSVASLTFETDETDTITRKCMIWTAITSFYLEFEFAELEKILGTNYGYPMNITVDRVPQSFSICTVEDRAANTYTIDYVASSTVDMLLMETEIVVGGSSTITVELRIEDMPAEFHLELGDGYMNVDVTSNVGLVVLNVTADIGLAGINNMINIFLRITDIPDFIATWHEDDTGNGFALDAVSCIGSIEMAFSYGNLMYPTEHDDDPDSHYLFVWSDPGTTAFAIRLLDVSHIGFEQINADASNELTFNTCVRHMLYIIAHTEVGSLLTPDTDVDLRIVLDETPTQLLLNWIVPFRFGLETNQYIDSITGDLTLETAGPPVRDLTAHAEILDIPDDMLMDIDPNGSILFLALSPIGTVELTASDPNGLPGTDTFFSGEPIRLMYMMIHDVPSFGAEWSIDSTWTSIAFNTAAFTSLGSLTFAISTAETDYVTTLGAEENRGMIYNDDYMDLGNGLVMEASIWVHVEDVSRAELRFGGTDPTYEVGFGAAVANELRAAARLDRTSDLNPAGANDDVKIRIVTTALPTSMDISITPSESFSYDASGFAIAHIDIDAWIGDLSPAAPVPADVDWVQLDVYDIPESIDGWWDVGAVGFFNLELTDGTTLGRIELVIENAFGAFGTNYVYTEAFIDSLPEDVNADWDLGARAVTIVFTDAAFTGGLGEAFILMTTMDETDTTNYINSLDINPADCMTSYSGYEEEIDERYWPGTTLENNLRATYCRNPELNTAQDDYFVYRTGAGDRVFTARIRELHEVDVDLGNSAGYAEIEWTPDVVLDRELYLRMEDVDLGDDDLVLA
ncbi:MAG: hypothetical protein JSU64_05535, partial [candidate division WOR-3 bacterium]